MFVFQITIDRQKNMVKMEFAMKYTTTFQNIFEAHIVMPYIDYLCLINIWPKMMLHALDLENEAFWVLSEAVTILAVVILKVVTLERPNVLDELVTKFPMKDSSAEDNFPDDLLTFLETNEFTSSYLDKLSNSRDKNVMKVLQDAKIVIKSLSQKSKNILTRTIFEGFVARKAHLQGRP